MKGKLLDVGCGKKPYSSIIAGSVDEYIGMDLESNKSNADIVGSCTNIPLDDNSVDTILCTQVLGDVIDPQKAMSEMYRVIKKDGYIVLTEDQTWPLHDIPYDFYRYTYYGLKKLAENQGFNVEYIQKRGGFSLMVCQRISSYIYYTTKELRKLRLIIVLPFSVLLQLLGLIFDSVLPDGGDTLGYIMVAKK